MCRTLCQAPSTCSCARISHTPVMQITLQSRPLKCIDVKSPAHGHLRSRGKRKQTCLPSTLLRNHLLSRPYCPPYCMASPPGSSDTPAAWAAPWTVHHVPHGYDILSIQFLTRACIHPPWPWIFPAGLSVSTEQGARFDFSVTAHLSPQSGGTVGFYFSGTSSARP